MSNQCDDRHPDDPVKASYDISTDLMLVLGPQEPPQDAGTRQQK